MVYYEMMDYEKRQMAIEYENFKENSKIEDDEKRKTDIEIVAGLVRMCERDFKESAHLEKHLSKGLLNYIKTDLIHDCINDYSVSHTWALIAKTWGAYRKRFVDNSEDEENASDTEKIFRIYSQAIADIIEAGPQKDIAIKMGSISASVFNLNRFALKEFYDKEFYNKEFYNPDPFFPLWREGLELIKEKNKKNNPGYLVLTDKLTFSWLPLVTLVRPEKFATLKHNTSKEEINLKDACKKIVTKMSNSVDETNKKSLLVSLLSLINFIETAGRHSIGDDSELAEQWEKKIGEAFVCSDYSFYHSDLKKRNFPAD